MAAAAAGGEDVLLLLREFYTAKQTPRSEGGFLVVGDTRIPLNTKTAFRSKRGTGPLYDVGAIWLYMENENLNHGDYVRKAKERNVQSVAHQDKKVLSQYLRSQADSLPYCDYEMLRQETGAAPRVDGERPVEGEPGAKRFRFDLEPARSRPGEYATLDDVLRQERRPHTRESALRSVKKVFSGLVKVYEESRKVKSGRGKRAAPGAAGARATAAPGAAAAAVAAAAAAPATGPLGARAASGTGAALVAAAKAKLTSAVPIIVVPSAVTSLLTLHNVKDLFEGNRFVSPQEKLASGVEKRDTVTIMGPSLRQPGRTVPYHVIDDPTKLPRGDWARIVAVFAHGAEWQFKEWQPPYNVPSDLFDRIAGFHLHYDDQQPPQLIQSWNVRRLRVSKTKRHNDTMLVVEFWKLLHERLRTRASAAALDL